MFNFLKKLFKLEPEQEDISIEQLEQWFKDKVESVYSNLDGQLKEKINSIPSIIETIKQHITELENAGIKDEEKIEPKVKQVVLGNRKNYIRILNQFIDSIEMPEEINAKTSSVFCSEIHNKLDELGKSTQKTYYTAQHLFPDQVERIAKDIKDIGKAVKAIKTVIEKNNITKIEDGKAAIQNLIKSIDRKERLKKDLSEAKEHLDKSQKLKQESETKLVNLRSSKEFDGFNKLKQEHDEIDNKLHNLKNQIIDLFSSLIPGLKKYQRVALENEDLIGKYIENPAKALLEDRNLEIIDVLQKMKNSILSNSIDLRDKKREKALEKIEQITKEKLKEILSDYDRLKGRESALDDKLKASKIMPLIEEAEYKLEHHTQMVEKIRKDIEKMEEDINKINIDEIEKEVQDKIKEAINVEIKLLSSNP